MSLFGGRATPGQPRARPNGRVALISASFDGRAVREALAVVLMSPPSDDAPGHERRTVLIVVSVIAVVLVAIALLAQG